MGRGAAGPRRVAHHHAASRRQRGRSGESRRAPEVFHSPVDGKELSRGRRRVLTGSAATLPGVPEIGRRTTGPSFPQKCADPAVVLDPGLYLCSGSSRRCGYVEKRPFRSSLAEFPSTACVENLGIKANALWMAWRCPHSFHSHPRFLHRFSPARSPSLGITSSLDLMTPPRPAQIMHRSYPQLSTGVESPTTCCVMSGMDLSTVIERSLHRWGH